MRPEILLVSEMIDAAEQARLLADGVTALELEGTGSAETPCSGI